MGENNIKYDSKNYRKHTEKNLNLIKKSLKECGTGRSILIDNQGEIIAGNATFKQAQAANIPVKIIETDGKELIALKRTDLKTDDEKRKKLALLDNSTSDKVEWDLDNLSADFDINDLAQYGLDDIKGMVEAAADFPELPEGDGSGFETMTFTLSSRQADLVRKAITEAKKLDGYKYADENENSNSNGNALACIVEEFLK